MNKKGIVILAAGNGQRLGSNIPKPLNLFMGKALLSHVLESIPTSIIPYVVINPRHRQQFQDNIQHQVHYIEQQQPLGTGNALQAALPKLKKYDSVIILYADAPLVPQSLIHQLLELPTNDRVVGFYPHDPEQYGIIQCNSNQALKILEPLYHEKYTRPIANSGILEISARTLLQVPKIKPCQKNHEYYLTQLVSEKTPFELLQFQGPPHQLSGINTPQQLQTLAQTHKAYLVSLIAEKANLDDHLSLHVDSEITVGSGVRIGPQVSLHGNITIGKNTHIETGCVLTDSIIGDDVHLRPYSIISHSTIESGATIGPFCHIQQQSNIGNNCLIGNFVEINRSSLGPSTKAKHLSYLGDAIIAEKVNIGAGVITCNYNPLKQLKFTTNIDAGAMIGANTSLIAPITIGKGTIVGAGCTLQASSKPYQLIIGHRSLQTKQLALPD